MAKSGSALTVQTPSTRRGFFRLIGRLFCSPKLLSLALDYRKCLDSSKISGRTSMMVAVKGWSASLPMEKWHAVSLVFCLQRRIVHQTNQSGPVKSARFGLEIAPWASFSRCQCQILSDYESVRPAMQPVQRPAQALRAPVLLDDT